MPTLHTIGEVVFQATKLVELAPQFERQGRSVILQPPVMRFNLLLCAVVLETQSPLDCCKSNLDGKKYGSRQAIISTLQRM